MNELYKSFFIHVNVNARAKF